MIQDRFGVHERVSTDKQLDGISLETQREMAMELVDSLGGFIYDYYTEEGLSAKKKRLNQRPSMLRLISDIEDGNVNHVIAYRRDRLWRNTEESLEFMRILIENNCKITLTARDENQIDLNEYRKNGGGKLLELILAQINEGESEATSVRVSDNMISKAKRGEFTGGITPYGYRSEKSHLIPIESEISIIEEIEDLYLKGYGAYSIARWLNNLEVRVLGIRGSAHKKLKQHKRSKETWTKESIEGILFNHVYCGYMKYRSFKNNKYDLTMEDIVVKSEFVTPLRSEEKQKKIDRLRRKKNEAKKPARHYATTFLLTGLLTCGECGSKFISRTTQKKGGDKYAYYSCKNNKNTDETRCTNKVFKKEVIESFVLNESKRYMNEFINSDTYELVQKELNKKHDDIDVQLNQINDDVRHLNKKQERIMDMLTDLDMDDVTYPIMKKNFQEKIKEIVLEITKLESTKDSLLIEKDEDGDKKVDIEFIEKTAKQFANIIEKAPLNLQKQLLEELFSIITIDSLGQVSLRLSVDLIPKDVERVVDFITIGGVGDTTTRITIDSKISEESLNINLFETYQEIIYQVSKELFPFIIHKNGGQKGLYKRMTKSKAIVESSYYHYKNGQRTPTYEVLIRILKEFNSTIQEFIDWINPPEKSFYSHMMKEALNQKAEFANKNVG